MLTNDLILNIFYYIATLVLIVKVFLLIINIRYISKNANTVPQKFSQKISLEEHQKAACYSQSRLKFKVVATLYHFILLLAWLPFGGLEKLDQLTRGLGYSSDTASFIFFGIYLIISIVLSLPESIYSTFFIEAKYGFNKTTSRIFINDLIKQFLLTICLMFPVLYAIFAFIENFEHVWWIYSWICLVAFQFLLMWAYPKIISPLFNKFSPLDDEELTSKVQKLSSDTKIKFKDYYVMNASLRSSHGNAYFTGFGKNKRIVFFDTLLNSLSSNEVVAVLAHELGHLKEKHILKSMVISTISLGIGFYILYLSYNYTELYSSFSLEKSKHIALLLFTFLIPQATFFLTPIMSWLSRRNEYSADRFSVRHSSGNDLINALVKMYKDNSSSLTPSPIFSKFYNSHPPALERVEFIESISTN